MTVIEYKICNILLSNKVFPQTEQSFGRFKKNILAKMTAVASLTHVWVMVDHKLQRSPKLKTAPIFQSVLLVLAVTHL